MFTAILLVTVLVDELDTAVEAKALPVTLGNVITVLPADAGAAKDKVPLVSPLIVN